MSGTDLIIAADFGTSGVKVGAVTPEMTLLAHATEPYPLDLPAPSCAEQAPADWWQALRRAVAQLAQEVPDLAARTGALSFAAQLCGLVCVDAQGQPLRPAMVWLDKRSAPLIRQKTGGFPKVAGYGARFLARSIRLANGAPSLNGMDPPGKMLWIARHEPEIFARTAHFLDVKDWLVLKATGEVSTGADSANLTWLMDTRRGREGWSPKLARHLGVPLDRMPPIVDGAEVVGGLTGAAAADLGLRPGTHVVGGGGDVTATALGSGAVRDGALHLCLSSSSWVAGFFGRRVLNAFAAYATVTSSAGYRPLLIATQECAGSALGWLAQTFGDTPGAFYERIGDYRADDPLYLPWMSGERVPVDEARVRGTFYGLDLRHDADAMKRAALEGVAFNTRWVFDKVVAERGASVDEALPVVGGAAANRHLVQLIADTLDRPVTVGETAHAGVLGAATLAAPAMGWADNVWQAAAQLECGRGPIVAPDPRRRSLLNDRYAETRRLRRAMLKLYRQRGDMP